MENTLSTKEELILKAENLFFALGYEATSVQKIIDEVGIAKGTFYHYFKSKEELLQAICEHRTNEATEMIKERIKEVKGDAVDKINALFSVSNAWKVKNVEVIQLILKNVYTDKNILLRKKVKDISLKKALPMLSTIVEEGVEEGLFHVENIEGVSELILRIGIDLGDAMADILSELFCNKDTKENIKRKLTIKIDTYELAINRLLGIEKRRIKLGYDESFLKICNFSV